MAAAIGIDAGSVSVKAVALVDDLPRAWAVEPTSPEVAAQCRRMIERVTASAGLSGDNVPVGATGYGRHLIEGAAEHVNEIMANATGAGWLRAHWEALEQIFGSPPSCPTLEEPFRTIVDLGGQDSKVIVFGSDGTLVDFAMNDRCAAGTGRFLEVMARALGVDLAGLDELARRADAAAPIGSTCTVFVESEVVSLLSAGVAKERIAAGVFEAVAGQLASLATRCGAGPPVLFDGGASHSRAMRRALERHLQCEVVVVPCGQLVTALGAAVAALDPVR